jgi:hypothetical protein
VPFPTKISTTKDTGDSHSDVFVPEGGSGTNELLHQLDAFGVLQNLEGDAAGAKKILLAESSWLRTK